MEVAYQVNKRKACDLCFLKKIKCDALKPTCSNCQIYKAECRTTKARNRISATRRQPREQAKPPSSPAPTVSAGKDGTNRIEDVESRLARVEHQLGLVFAAPSAAPVQAGDDQHKAAPAQDPDQFLSDFDYTALNEANQILGQPQSDMVPLGNAFTSKLPALDADIASGLVGDPYPCLPPLAEIQPAIADYFVHVNSLIPLFSEAAFMRMLQEYYASTCRQPRAAWAAVNVVLALATRVPVSPSSDLDLGFGDSQVAHYVNNVQSVLSELVTRDVDLLSLQVVLGLVIVFNALKDPSPAVVLVGTAVRLAHRLRLHNRRYQEQFPPAEILQRNRVFWITYLFDKDICLRHHTPSVQVDEDIDLDLPLEEPQDGAGNIYSKDGSRANFFRLRLRLAHIQGRVYNLLFSTQAAKITDQERRARIALLHHQLERWRLALPSDLQVDVVTELANRTALIWLCMMHFSYLGCLVMIHGIWSHDAQWRERLTAIPAHSRGTSEAEDASRLSPPLPRGWRNCVQMSRHCMAMMTQMPLSDCSVWANGCAYFSALIILQANLFDNTTHENVDKDLQLTKFAVNVIDQMSDASTIMQMKRMNVVAAELDRRVRLVVDHARQGVATSQPVPSVATVSPSETLNDHITYKDSDTELQWGWANDGVDAWPGLDVSIKKEDTTIQSKMSGGPFDEWIEVQFSNTADATFFTQALSSEIF
ncbi:fungal-specific transcription factor domain-containing protein [Lipomyces tetrasporus]